MEPFITAVTAAENFLLGLFTYLKNPKSDTHRSFAFLTVIISAWAIANYFSLHSPTTTETLFWIRMVMFITAPLGPTIFLLAKAFPDTSAKLPKKVLWALSIFSIVTMVLGLSPLMFTDVKITNGNITPTPGPALPLFA